MILLSESQVVMSDELIGVIITAIVTSVISIIGFIATNMSMRKNFKNELIKERDNIALQKMSTMPYDILELMDEMMKDKTSKTKETEIAKFSKTLNSIYSYGSEKAIQIVALMQKENYAANGNVEKMDRYRMISTYVLLATQIKYDVTGTMINPEFWFRMRLTDYEVNKEKIKMANNKLVKELDLSEKMKIH